jgi:hypothetical protein
MCSFACQKHMFFFFLFNCKGKVERVNTFLIKFISTLFLQLKKACVSHIQMDVCHFYRLSCRKFLQPSLVVIFVLKNTKEKPIKVKTHHVSRCKMDVINECEVYNYSCSIPNLVLTWFHPFHESVFPQQFDTGTVQDFSWEMPKHE